jgi:Zn-dependent M28 family amino/carboxypeptidase
MRSRARLAALALLAFAGTGVRAQDRPAGVRQLAPVSASRVARELSVLAADSLEGRQTGSRGSAIAARFIAQALREAGLAPAGDAGYFQRVSVAWPTSGPAVNVVGLLPGGDPALAGEAVVVTAHYDHLGIGPAVNGDSIYNGADDDASGTVAAMEIARALARARPAPKRTIVFLLVTGEEHGLIGTRWYLDHPVVPLERTVANLNLEMIARPDPLAGGRGKAWLTGYDRSTVGAMLRAAGIPIVPDPRPQEDFFERSDNIAFAQRGIPAHTLSSYNLHADYHQPSDEAGRADPEHMARVITAAARAVALLADGPAPAWTPGDSLAAGRRAR